MNLNKLSFKTQRHKESNIVYWPLSLVNKASGYKRNLKALEQDDANRWREHMQAVAKMQDRNAFQVLYLHFAPKIKSFYMHQGMASMAEELTHEVFLRVWNKAGSYNFDKAKVSTWIFTIARNLKIDHLRKKKIVEVSDEKQDEATVDGNIEEKLDLRREKQSINLIIKQLTGEQRQVIQKVYFEDKSHSEVATELGMTLGEVKSRVRSSLQFLRKNLGGDKS